MKQVPILFACFLTIISGEKVWKFTTNYAVTVMNFRKELLEVELKTEPISMAVLGVSGYFDLKEDMNEAYKVSISPIYQKKLRTLFIIPVGNSHNQQRQ